MTKKKKIIIAAVAAAVIIASVVGVILYLRREAPSVDTENNTGIELDSNAVTGMTLPDSVDGESEGIRIAGYPEITIPAGETEVALNLLNPEGNPCYFTFCLTLKETGEVLYTSKAVKPGYYIGNAELNRPLEEGEYDINIHITTNSLKDNSPMNDANVDSKLIVK